MSKALGILVPTYNRCTALMECLACLERQTFRDFSVVVIDDGSSDSTADEMRRYLDRTPLTVQYARQQNSGPAKARNLGISLITEPICLMLGDDIFATPSLAERHMDLHTRLPQENVAGLGLTKWSTSGQTVTRYMEWLGKSPYQFAYGELIQGKNPTWEHFYTSNLSVKTQLLRQFPFDERFPYAAMEDTELGYRLERRVGLQFRFLPEALAYHLHPTTFRQSCARMIKVGYSRRLMDEIWPENSEAPRTGWRKLSGIAMDRVASSPTAMKLLVGMADMYTKAVCPNPLLRAALSCSYRVGYENRRSEAALSGNG